MDIDSDIIEALSHHGDRGQLMAFLAQGEACAWCRRPVRLSGERYLRDPASGARRLVFSSHPRPGGVVLKACGNRRETRCPSCAALYRSDARHLVKAGLQGGKGVAESVGSHPAVLLTLTAPSFGAVHRSAPGRGPCRPGPARRCVHGGPVSCFLHHEVGDELTGSAICPDCYDYETAVLHNAVVPELWRRTSLYIPRRLARILGITQARCRATYRVSYLRVAEFQRRGAVHLHVIVRLDTVDGTVPDISVEVLAGACLSGARAVSVTLDGRLLVWGEQMDVAVLDREVSKTGRLAAYVAKYATKSSERSGALDDPIFDEGDLSERRLPVHERHLAEAAWALGGDERFSHLRLRRYAHLLGYGGQFLCKSRRYSTTFGALRGARAAWREAQPPRLPDEPAGASYEARWMAVGVGWAHPGGAKFAEVARRPAAYAKRLEFECEVQP